MFRARSSTVALLMVLISVCTAASILDELSRIKRQVGDIKAAEIKAVLALEGGCAVVACGMINFGKRLKRTSSDQRIAELQALIALSRGGGMIGHGRIDPYGIGKKKKSSDSPNSPGNLRNRLMNILVGAIHRET